MDDFYVYLPSNVKSIFFENTSANFKTKLSQILHLKNEYEVGLAEITYTFAILNVFDDEIINIVYLNNAGEIDKTSVTLKKGFYTIEDLIKSINNIIQLNISYITLPKFELNNENVINLNNHNLLERQQMWNYKKNLKLENIKQSQIVKDNEECFHFCLI